MDRQVRRVERCGPLLGLTVLFALSAAGGEEQRSVQQAVKVTDEVVKAMVRGDPRPMLRIWEAGPLTETVMSRVGNTDGLSAAATGHLKRQYTHIVRGFFSLMAKGLEGGEYFILRPRAEGGRLTVPVRIETAEDAEYWLLHYARGAESPRLQSLELPLIGMDVASYVLDLTPDPSTLVRKTETEQEKSFAYALGYYVFGPLLLVVLAFGLGYKWYRRDWPTGSICAYLRHPGFYLPLILILISVGVAGVGKRAGKRPSQRTPESELGTPKARLGKLVREGRFREAEGLSRELLKRSPSDVFASVFLVRSLRCQNKREAARTVLTGMLERGRAGFFAHGELGELAIEAGDWGAAVSHLEANLAHLGNDDLTMTFLANVHMEAGNYAEAHGWSVRALEINPNRIGAIVCRARIFVREDKLDAAAPELRKLVELGAVDVDGLASDEDFSRLRSDPKYADIFRATE